ncbi:PREDICTED: protein lin-52 homolog [Nipponia nippon]|uniref:protein lin-52 homolog n=1 Tax=Nipponia nippon TaxID=128390 RepID=UPI00051186B2|nr:PREDICTED: protein lin-52 homolog [Nipponia nippon]
MRGKRGLGCYPRCNEGNEIRVRLRNINGVGWTSNDSEKWIRVKKVNSNESWDKLRKLRDEKARMRSVNCAGRAGGCCRRRRSPPAALRFLFAVPGVAEFAASFKSPITSSPPKWMAELENDDIDMLKELGSLTTANLMEKVRGLQNLAYQLGLDESREMTRGKFLNILEKPKK